MMGGAVIGLCGMTIPLILFSGEEEMAEQIMDDMRKRRQKPTIKTGLCRLSV